jgi:hypothetical protein
LGGLRLTNKDMTPGWLARSRRCIHGAVADPLSLRAAKNPNRGPRKIADSVGWKNLMGILLVIMFITLGLAVRAATVNRRASLAGSETSDVTGVVDAYARTSLLVLVCLVGLFSLGLVYGNVLGGIAAP